MIEKSSTAILIFLPDGGNSPDESLFCR